MKDEFLKHGFTLAEVIITLGIIGVVAALTIPNLIADQRKAQYIVGMKKAYSIWSQALLQMSVDAGTPGDLSNFFTSNSNQTMGDKIVPYFKILKNCDTTQKGCWADSNAQNFDSSDYSANYDSTGVWYKFVTADGMLVEIANSSQGCVGSQGTLTKMCAKNVNIDVNGLAGPNTMGRDIIAFAIINDNGPAIYPWGGQRLLYWKTSHDCDYGYAGGTNKFGYYCPGRIIDDGWQMTY